MRTGSHFWLVTQYVPHPGGTQLRHHAGRKWCASAQFTSNNNMAKLESQRGIDTAFDFYFKR